MGGRADPSRRTRKASRGLDRREDGAVLQEPQGHLGGGRQRDWEDCPRRCKFLFSIDPLCVCAPLNLRGLNPNLRFQVFLSDMQHFKEMNGEYEKWFTHKPARTCVAVKQLPLGVDVEIEAIAIQ